MRRGISLLCRPEGGCPDDFGNEREVLGPCRADLDEIDQLLFGTFIEKSAAKLADPLWKLHQATEPKFVQADSDSSADGRLTGIESPLVGQPGIFLPGRYA